MFTGIFWIQINGYIHVYSWRNIHTILSRCIVWMLWYVCARFIAVLDDNIWWKTHSINHIADFVYFELHDCIYGYWYMYFRKILLKSFFIVYSPVPSLPTTNGLPPTRSPRPYTTFELDQIRQHAKRYFLLSITRLGCGQISLYC